MEDNEEMDTKAVVEATSEVLETVAKSSKRWKKTATFMLQSHLSILTELIMVDEPRIRVPKRYAEAVIEEFNSFLYTLEQEIDTVRKELAIAKKLSNDDVIDQVQERLDMIEGVVADMNELKLTPDLIETIMEKCTDDPMPMIDFTPYMDRADRSSAQRKAEKAIDDELRRIEKLI